LRPRTDPVDVDALNDVPHRTSRNNQFVPTSGNAQQLDFGVSNGDPYRLSWLFSMTSICLPTLEQVEFHSFSLYSNRPSQKVPVERGVFCLAGANGLGKSTFLSAVGYALTGVVVDPDDRFESVEEHYLHNLDYAARYFEGRIDEHDRASADISASFRVGEHRYRLTRGLFEREALRSLEVTDVHGDSLIGNPTSDADRQRAYEQQLTADLGLSSFSQYAFLHHFVLTFDERRRLLFWDPLLMERALYIAFGIASEDAERADKLRRQVDRADSRRRNAQYQATEARNRLHELHKAAGRDEDKDDSTGADYEKLVTKAAEAEQTAVRARTALDDAQLELTRVLADELSLRSDYEREFAAHLDDIADPASHPVVTSTLEEHRCAVCGTRGDAVASQIAERLDAAHCPLCDSEVASGEDNPDAAEALKHIAALASEMESTAQLVLDKHKTVDRLGSEVTAANNLALEARSAVTDFESEHNLAAQAIAAAGTGLEAAEQQLNAEIEGALQRKEEWRVKRDGYRSELRQIQAKLADGYRSAELEFVPLFTDLAQDFLGLDLELQLNVKRNTDVELVLTVEGTRRRALDQLSESQRYFIDIALRMALAQHMIGEDSPATLFIDTPEGSLDLAYEKRAGQMFADFVSNGNSVVMTANLNASQLLRQLAARCGREHMELVRMIDWRELSDVQAEAEELFDLAYDDIERTLDGGAGTS
jgi:DNA repair exonuclease SbcCD ATPase subunit